MFSIIRANIAPTIIHAITLFGLCGFLSFLKGSGCSYSMYTFGIEQRNNTERAKYLICLSRIILLLYSCKLFDSILTLYSAS